MIHTFFFPVTLYYDKVRHFIYGGGKNGICLKVKKKKINLLLESVNTVKFSVLTVTLGIVLIRAKRTRPIRVHLVTIGTLKSHRPIKCPYLDPPVVLRAGY